MCGVITASEPSWTVPFTGLSPRQFGMLVTALRWEGADPVRRGRPWGPLLEDRVLLGATYRRTNLTLRQLAPLLGISKSAANRIANHLAPLLALQQRRRFRKGSVLIVDGTLVPTRDHKAAAHTIPERADQIRNRARRGSRGGRPPAFDPEVYKRRNMVERCFNRLKQRRGIATRYDKTAESYQPAASPSPHC